MATKQEIITLINGTIIENVRGQISATDVKTILTDITTEMVATNELDAVLEEQTESLELIKNDTIAASQIAKSQYDDKGPYNASLNIPFLSVSYNPIGLSKQPLYTVTVSGSASFAGTNFTSGSVLQVGDELRGLSGSWYKTTPNNLALQKVQTIEGLVYNTETVGNLSNVSNTSANILWRTVVSQNKFINLTGKISTFRITSTGISGNIRLLVLRKNSALQKYVEVSRYTIAVNSGTNVIDVNSLNISVLTGDIIALQVIESGVTIGTNTAGTGLVAATFADSSAIVEFTAASLETNSNNGIVCYSVDVNGEFTNSTKLRLNDLKSVQSKIELDLYNTRYYAVQGSSFPDNGFYTPSGSYNTSTSWKSVTINVKTGIFTYSVYSTLGASIITFFNESGVKISSVDTPTSGLVNYTNSIAVPSGSVKAVLSTSNTNLNLASYTYQLETVDITKQHTSDIKTLADANILNITDTIFTDNGFYPPSGSYNTSANWKSVTIYPKGSALSYNVTTVLGASIVTFFTSSSVKISSVDAVPTGLSAVSGSVGIPPNTYKAVISTHNNGLSTANYTYGVNISTKVLENTSNLSIKEDKSIYKTFTVSKTGTPSSTVFNTIGSALAAWSVGTQILIYDGIYEEISLVIPDKAYLKGIGIVEIRGYLPVTSTTVDVDAKSTLDFANSGTLENLIITAKNMRYPVHSDFGNPNAIQNIINCRIIHYGNEEIYKYRVSNSITAPNDAASVWRATSAWGCGTQAGSKIYLKNTYLESPGRALSTHNNTNYNLAGGASLLQADNCEFVSHGIDRDGTFTAFVPSIFIQSLSSKTLDKIVLNNTKVNGHLVLQSTSADWREFTQDIVGSGLTSHLMQVRNVAGGGKLMTDETAKQTSYILKVTGSNTQPITISGSLVTPMFGNYYTLSGSVGLNSYIKGQVNHGEMWAAINASSNKTITFTNGPDIKTLTLSTTYTSATQVVNDMNSQFGSNSFVAELYWLGFDWYPKFTNEIGALRNTGNTAILRGRAVKLNGYNKISLMTSSDSASLFYGIAVQDIPVGKTGNVKFKGYMLKIWVDGLYNVTLNDNDNIKVNSDGTFSVSPDGSGVVVSKCISNENISINI